MKNPGGRPVKFKTPKELQDAVDEYFEWCDNRTKKIWSEKTQSEYLVSDPAPYTMHGLARRLGLSRQGLIEYKNKDTFSDAIKAARDKVGENVETIMMDGKAQAGSIFNLKNNFGWKDRNETDITSGGKTIQPIIGNVSAGNSDQENTGTSEEN